MILKDRYIAGKKYVSENWRTMSDETLATNLGYSVRAVKMMRNDLNITRYEFSIALNKTKAMICEMYVSKVPIKEIAGIIGRSVKHIVKIIDTCLRENSSDNTETITKQSSV